MRTVVLVRTLSEVDPPCIDVLQVADRVTDVLGAIKAAAQDFVNTPDGMAYAESINWDFNWGDALQEIPDEILSSHGITALGHQDHDVITVNNYEVILDELEPLDAVH